MKRDILFRGKRIDNGKWVEGDLRQDKDLKAAYISGWDYYPAESGVEREPFEYEVDPATVGQYTGLMDKNEKKIFESDIISYYGSRETVYFDTSLRIPCFTTGIGRGSSTSPHPYKLSARHVVIGNIHDNPELLEVQK